MGTPDFAVPSLDILLRNNYYISGVITSPDKPAGRGQLLTQSPVKKFAMQHKIKILQPLNLKSNQFVYELNLLKPDLQIVVAFRMLPEIIWSMPPLGTFNLHASLLPQYRGAAPINWAIINGETETGVTTFFLKQVIDTGDIILQKSVQISNQETAGDLHDKLMNIGAKTVLETVQAIESKNYTLNTQNTDLHLKCAPKIFKENCKINWSDPTYKIYNFIRGLSPYPGAWAYLRKLSNGEQKILKIYKATVEDRYDNIPTGKIISDNTSFIKVCTDSGYINLLELQMENRKKMSVLEFLRGYKISDEEVA